MRCSRGGCRDYGAKIILLPLFKIQPLRTLDAVNGERRAHHFAHRILDDAIARGLVETVRQSTRRVTDDDLIVADP